MILKRKCFIRQPNINVCFFKVVSAFGVLFVLLPISQRAKAMVIYPMFVCKPLFRTTFLTSTGSLSQIIDGFSDSFSTEEKFHVLFIFRIFEFVFSCSNTGDVSNIRIKSPSLLQSLLL